MAEKQYFGFRIAKNYIQYLTRELDEGRLRQGWGWDDRQNLNNLTMEQSEIFPSNIE